MYFCFSLYTFEDIQIQFKYILFKNIFLFLNLYETKPIILNMLLRYFHLNLKIFFRFKRLFADKFTNEKLQSDPRITRPVVVDA